MGDDPDFGSLVDLLSTAAERYGDRELMRFGATSWSYRQVDEWTSQLAHHLIDAGVAPGDRVAIMLPNVAQWPISWLGILKAGAVAVPVNSSYRADDLEFVLRDSGAMTVLTDEDLAGLVKSVVSGSDALDGVAVVDVAQLDLADRPTLRPDLTIEAQSLANLQYTSGTTGFPKACMLTHDYWLRQGWITCCVCQVAEDDTVLTSQPFSYMDPQWNLAMVMIAGATLVVLPRFSASGFMEDVRRHDVTVFYVLGTMPALLLKQPPHPQDRDNKLRAVMCSGIPAALHADLEDRWGAPWREGYGMTETGVDLVTYVEDVDTVGSGVIGRPVPSKRVRVIDLDGSDVADGEPGELITSGRPMMLGYWNRPEATAETLRDGWLHTGDLAVRDQQGNIRLVGRLKDMVRRGGENISCVEVEQVLMRSNEVTECAVVPVPDELFGEEVKAFVQLADGVAADRRAAERLIEHARDRLARFKVPRYVEFVTTFPKTPSERIAKAVLKDRSTSPSGETYDLQQERTSHSRVGQSQTESAGSR
jgi:acyl-CoA synthetase (AMP-forming)/AMP-acid ligase II